MPNVTVEILDVIGPSEWGWIDQKAVSRQIESAKEGDTITVRINSPGGDAWEGIGIHNVLKQSPATVVVKVDGIAASAASIVAMAGDRVEMPSNTMLMIHNAWSLAIGEAGDLRKQADLLDKLDDSLAVTYAERGNKDKAHFAALMDEETWLTAEEAVGLGLADAVIRGGQKSQAKAMTPRAANFAMSHFSKLPPTVAALLTEQPMAKKTKAKAEEQTAPVAEQNAEEVVAEEAVAETPAEPVAETPAPEATEAPAEPVAEQESQEAAPEAETQTEGQEEAPAAQEEAPTETPAPVAGLSGREQCRKFIELFGAEAGAGYFAEGLDLVACYAKHTAKLSADNAALQTRLDAALAAVGEEKPVSFSPADSGKKGGPVKYADASEAIAIAAASIKAQMQGTKS